MRLEKFLNPFPHILHSYGVSGTTLDPEPSYSSALLRNWRVSLWLFMKLWICCRALSLPAHILQAPDSTCCKVQYRCTVQEQVFRTEVQYSIAQYRSSELKFKYKYKYTELVLQGQRHLHGVGCAPEHLLAADGAGDVAWAVHLVYLHCHCKIQI